MYVHYERTKNKLHRKTVQCVKAMEQLCKMLKYFHYLQIVEENYRRDRAPSQNIYSLK